MACRRSGVKGLVRKAARVPDVQAVLRYSYLNVAKSGVVTMDQRIHERLTQGVQWVLPDLASLEILQPTARWFAEHL
jgi:hypothetical protein